MKPPLFLSLILMATVSCTVPCLAQEKKAPAPPRMSQKDTAHVLVASSVYGALGKIGDPKAKAVLMEGAKSKQAFVRAYAVGALAGFDDPAVIALLREKRNDSDPLVRIMAVYALLMDKEPEMDAAMAAFLKDTDPSIQAQAIQQMGLFGETFRSQLMDVIKHETIDLLHLKALEQLALIGPPHGAGQAAAGVPTTISIIGEGLSSPNPDVRRASCLALGGMANKKAIPLLLEYLGDENIFVRAAAKEALAFIGEDSLIPFFRNDLTDPDPILRASSYLALARLNDITVIPELLTVVTAPGTSLWERKKAAQALAILTSSVSKLLDKALMVIKVSPTISSENVQPCFAAGGKTLVAMFIDALVDPADPLHADAALILKELGPREALPALRMGLSSNDPNMVAECAYVLGELKDAQSVDELLKAVSRF